MAGDTIVANLYADAPFALGYWVSDFNNVTVGAEWLIPLGKFLEVGIGVNYYSETVPSYYLDLANANRSRDHAVDLRLQTVPITGTLRFDHDRPARDRAALCRGGRGSRAVGVLGERATSSIPTCDIFRWDYKDSGTAVGAVIFGGLRVRARTGRSRSAASSGTRWSTRRSTRTSASRARGWI